MGDSRLKVIYVSGAERSGTTILGSVLGQIRGFFFVGEVLSIWRYFVIDGGLCACGLPGSECVVWKDIFDEAFGGLEKIDAMSMDRVRQAKLASLSAPHMLGMLAGKRTRTLRRAYSEQLANLRKLYLAIQSTTGCDVVVDTSKRPGYGYLLTLLEDLDVHVVHMIRDPRAVAYSWTRAKAIPATSDGRTLMREYSPVSTALRWVGRNQTIELVSHGKSCRYTQMLYEDFVTSPESCLMSIARLASASEHDFPFLSENTVELGVNHSVRGNPGRFQTGAVRLKLDTEWRQKMATKEYATVTALTWPLLARYGYRVRRGSKGAKP